MDKKKTHLCFHQHFTAPMLENIFQSSHHGVSVFKNAHNTLIPHVFFVSCCAFEERIHGKVDVVPPRD